MAFPLVTRWGGYGTGGVNTSLIGNQAAPGRGGSGRIGNAPVTAAGSNALGSWDNSSQIAETGRQGRFNQVFGALSGLAGQFSQDPYTIGGRVPKGPEITVGPVWNEQQIQQQVNAQRANTDAATANQVRDIQSRTGGSGFGSNSPLAMSLAQGARNQALATNVGNEQQTRWGAAQGNAQQVFQTQEGRQQAWQQRQQDIIQRAAPYFQQRSTLLSALAGLV